LRRSYAELGSQRIECSLADLKPVEIRLVEGDGEDAFWERFVGEHHYLGYQKYRGRRVRYLICARRRVIGAIGWKSGSLKLESRDCFIGWSIEQRRQYLAHILNNDRFLIVGGVRVKNLASHVLGRNIRMVKEDWENRYGLSPYLLESFIDPRLFRGSCYRAAGWQCVGKTKGYEKLHCGYRYHGRVKEVYVYVVEPEFRKVIGCKKRSCPQRRSRIKNREGKLRMMIQEVGYDPDLIDWAEIGQEMVGRLAEELVEFHGLFADCFKRSEQRLLSESYLSGLLSDIPHKTAESIALSFLGTEAVRCQQNFLSRYLWDDERMLERHQRLLVEAIGEEDGMLSVDSSEVAKKGKESVGVARQYCGSLGKTENCQSGVFVGYSSRIGYALVDRRLYVPEVWFTEAYAERRKKCGIPEDLRFQTKIQIALELLEAQWHRGLLPDRWIGCDSFFGVSKWFRDTVAGWGKLYLAEIRSNMLVWPAVDAEGNREQKARAVSGIAGSDSTEWERVVLAEGSKGSIVADVSLQRVRENRDNKPGKELWLLIRRLEGGKLKYYFSNAPKDIPHEELRRALLMRWPIEQCFEDGKRYLGMDHYEHRTWKSWHRHMLYVFLALLFLLRVRLALKKNSHSDTAPGSETAHRILRAPAARQTPGSQDPQILHLS
jgi:SRSO17 transposase